MRLEKWSVWAGHAYGEIFDDENGRFEDGTDVRTSTIMNPKEIYKEGDEIKTRNSLYTLGKPDGEGV
jgi:hypothetical protein